jgi:hypothetical protein
MMTPPPRQCRRRPKIRSLLPFRDAAQAVSGSLGIVEAAVLYTHLDKLREKLADRCRYADGRSMVVRTLRGALEQVPRQCDVASSEVQGGIRPDGVGMLFQSLQQLLGFFKAALPDP